MGLYPDACCQKNEDVVAGQAEGSFGGDTSVSPILTIKQLKPTTQAISRNMQQFGIWDRISDPNISARPVLVTDLTRLPPPRSRDRKQESQLQTASRAVIVQMALSAAYERSSTLRLCNSGTARPTPFE
ncbi:hypothetical protein RBB50_007027 [Rhinocladiella similis]